MAVVSLALDSPRLLCSYYYHAAVEICELALLTGEGSHRRHQSASQSIASEMAFSHRELHAIFLENCLPFQLSVNQQMLQSVPYHGGVNLNQRTADSSTLLHMVG